MRKTSHLIDVETTLGVIHLHNVYNVLTSYYHYHCVLYIHNMYYPH